MNEPYEYLKDRVNCLWINFDSYDFQNIIIENGDMILDIPVEQFLKILRVYFKKKHI